MENIIFSCPFCNKKYQSKNAWCSHKGKCKLNPDYIIKPKSEKWKLAVSKPLTENHKKKIANSMKGNQNGKGHSHLHTKEQKQKISASMKKAHAEGRAHNIGECRWNNEPSYPEQWFMKVLKNEFGLEKDKDYKTEFPFHRFSLDFAWPEKKVCIEIDGEQHERFQEQKDRDIEKDKLLKEEGWTELRKLWKDIFNSPKVFIEEIKNLGL